MRATLTISTMNTIPAQSGGHKGARTEADMGEPMIIINGKLLTVGQAMTVRVALGAFAVDLQDGLGDDDHGKEMTAGYKARLSEIFKLCE